VSLSECTDLFDYFRRYGEIHVQKAESLLSPLHVVGRDALPDFSDIQEFAPDRYPFEPQQHCVAAITKMWDETGGGFLAAECGSGKTIMAILAAHVHAKRVYQGKARVAVMCPDHIVEKWVEEVSSTLPGARVRALGSWRDLIPLYDEAASGSTDDKQWKRPEGLEWLIIGRDQSKFMPDWRSIGDPGNFFGGEQKERVGASTRVIGYEDKLDEYGRCVHDSNWNRIRVPVTGQLYSCPKCGSRLVDPKRGTPLDPTKSNSKLGCTARYAVEIPNGDGWQGRDIARPHNAGSDGGSLRLPLNYSNATPGRRIKLAGKQWEVCECGEPWWQWTRKPYRFAPATFIHKKMKGVFDYCIIDEVHEAKSLTAAQANAAGKLMASSRYALALTGTLIGGYAWHLFPLLMRLRSSQVIADGFKWGQMIEWSRRYGRIDTYFKIKHDDEPERYTQSRRVRSMRKCRTGKQDSGTPKTAPGVMPSLFSNHLIGCSVFLQLADLADHLPALTEYIGCPPGEEETYRVAGDSYWTNCCVPMAEEQYAEAKRIEAICKAANDKLLQSRCMKFLSATLVVSMEYPDHPWGWLPEFDGKHSVGYWRLPNLKTEDNWEGVVTPRDLPQDVTYPKEKKLIEICLREKLHGNQTWVYVQQTGKRDIQPRLKQLLEDAGLKVGILRAKNVKPRDRIKWIEDNGLLYDVMISHPKPVCTGIDLLSKADGGHNFNAIVFYQTGTHPFVCKQASRRAWRIIQQKPCRVYYLYYHGTMQHRFVGLMAKKFAAMAAVDGDFSAEGLAGMTGADDGSLDLCRELGNKIDDSLIHRHWAKVQGAAQLSRKLPDGGAQVGEVPAPLPDCGVQWDAVQELIREQVVDRPEVIPMPDYMATEEEESDWESDFDDYVLTERELALFDF
jgi:hypothetical protein